MTVSLRGFSSNLLLDCSAFMPLARVQNYTGCHGSMELTFHQGVRRSPIFRYALCLSQSMPRGSKTKYTAKQKRQAEHIEESYEHRGASKRVAEKRAWQTVNKQSGGGEKAGGGRRVGSKAKKAARKESGRRAARSRKIGSSRTQKTPTRHKAFSS